MNMKERLSDLARIIKSQFGASTNCRSQGKNCRSVAIPNVLPRPDFVGIAGQLSESVPLSDGAIFGHASSRHCPTVLHPDLDSEVQAGTIGAGLTSRDYFAQYFQTL
jgi:hypothetical protein